MIHVHERVSVPPTFTAAVTGPGATWLAANPTKAPKEKLPAYWRAGSADLRAAYKGICAYFCCYVRPVTGTGSADHFVAKSSDRARAYDWSNYRFACTRMNSRKRDASDVLDPFTLADGWFELYFPTMRVRPSATLTKAQAKEVRATIKRLKLNSHECVSERGDYWDDYQSHGLSATRLYQYAPLIALEAVRQGLLKPADHGLTAAHIRTWLDS